MREEGIEKERGIERERERDTERKRQREREIGFRYDVRCRQLQRDF